MTDDNGFVDFSGGVSELDPAVAALLKQGERRQAEARLPRKERQKKIKERQRGKKRLAGRVNWDLPPELKQIIVDMAEKESVPASQVAALALLGFLRDIHDGQLDLSEFKVSSSSPKFEFSLDLENELDEIENLYG